MLINSNGGNMKTNIVYSLLLCTLIVLLPGCGGDEDKTSTKKIVADRQMVMRDMSSSVDNLENILFGEEGSGSNQAILQHALLLKEMSEKIPERFSQKTKEGQGGAKSNIWRDKEKFDEAAKELKAKVDEFVAAVETNDKEIMRSSYHELDMRSVCIKCHEEYRKTKED
jgi:cytochrome c556